MFIPVGFYLTKRQKESIIEAKRQKTGVSVEVNHVNGPAYLELTKTQMKQLQKAGALFCFDEVNIDLCEDITLHLSSKQVQKSLK